MSNHVHYLIEPDQPDDLPKIMHFLNWYTAIAVLMQVRYRLTPPPAPPRHGEGSKTPVPPSLVGKGARGLGLGIPHLTENRYMCFNRMLRRTGHFWEKRYFCDGFPASDRERALNTLRYIHGNPKAAKMRHGFFYDFSNYGSYERLTDDGLTHWHPAFLRLGNSLDECARKYKGFCQKYKPKEKTPSKCHWGSRLLGGVHLTNNGSTTNPKKSKSSASQHSCQVSENSELTMVVRQFIQANRVVNEVEKEF